MTRIVSIYHRGIQCCVCIKSFTSFKWSMALAIEIWRRERPEDISKHKLIGGSLWVSSARHVSFIEKSEHTRRAFEGEGIAWMNSWFWFVRHGCHRSRNQWTTRRANHAESQLKQNRKLFLMNSTRFLSIKRFFVNLISATSETFRSTQFRRSVRHYAAMKLQEC